MQTDFKTGVAGPRYEFAKRPPAVFFNWNGVFYRKFQWLAAADGYHYISIPCCCTGDEGRIKQILINILNNAIKFTKEGYVRISITGEPGGADEERITFRVEDTGCGIREEDWQDALREDLLLFRRRREGRAATDLLALALSLRILQSGGGQPSGRGGRPPHVYH